MPDALSALPHAPSAMADALLAMAHAPFDSSFLTIAVSAGGTRHEVTPFHSLFGLFWA